MSNIEKVKLDLCFLGERTYIQGASLFDELSKIVNSRYGSNAYISSFVVRRFSKHECIFVLDNSAQKEAFATCTISTPKGKVKGYVVETDNAIKSHREYNEILIYATAILHDKYITQNNSVEGFSPVEQLVSLTKHLHNHLMPITGKRWVFVQLDLEKPLYNEGLFTITMKQVIPERFTLCTVMQSNEEIGTIRFAAANP